MKMFSAVSPSSWGLFFGLWLLFFLLAKYQFKKAKELTIALVLSEITDALNSNPELTVDDYYEMVYAKWRDLIKQKIWFIPHRLELWPMPAKPEYVRNRLNFTPEWLGAFLILNGDTLMASDELQNEIDQIVNKSQKLA